MERIEILDRVTAAYQPSLQNEVTEMLVDYLMPPKTDTLLDISNTGQSAGDNRVSVMTENNV